MSAPWRGRVSVISDPAEAALGTRPGTGGVPEEKGLVEARRLEQGLGNAVALGNGCSVPCHGGQTLFQVSTAQLSLCAQSHGPSLGWLPTRMPSPV